jgi:hypothetical protein
MFVQLFLQRQTVKNLNEKPNMIFNFGCCDCDCDRDRDRKINNPFFSKGQRASPQLIVALAALDTQGFCITNKKV